MKISLNKKLIPIFCSKYLGRQAWANSVDPNQTMVYTAIIAK